MIETLQTLRDHVAKAALSMIDWANHKPENRTTKPKVGGHQASSMSGVDILCALYLDVLRANDRVCVKPHAAPVLYALMHLFGALPREQLGRLREIDGPQPYPTKLKHPTFVDYTSSSEALGPAATIYDAYGAIHQNRALTDRVDAAAIDHRFYAHCGDGELTEGQIDESLYDAGRWRLPNLVWIVDLNRQSLDRVMEDSDHLDAWVEAKFRSHGWETRQLRWGSRARDLFQRRGGDALRGVLEGMSDALFHPLLLVDGATARKILLGQVQHDDPHIAALLRDYAERLSVADTNRGGVARALADVDDATLAAALRHPGGHDLAALIQAFDDAAAAEGPICLIAHTIKGYETSAAAHPENHGALLSADEVAGWGLDRGLPADTPYPVPGAGTPAALHLAERAALLVHDRDHTWAEAPVAEHRAALAAIPFKARRTVSTGEAFQSVNLALLRTSLADHLQFGAPDVGLTTHLGPIIKQTGVFAPRPQRDTFAWLRAGRQVAFDWRPSDHGQFHALGIAEGNAMLWAYAFGRRRKVCEGRVPLLPVVTVYDKFFERCFNQLDYAVYSDARFVAVGTPSGTGLSRETATHQSLQTLRMMMDLPGLLAYEPGFAADVHAIYLHALAQLWDDDGEAVYLRLTTQPLGQPAAFPADHAAAAVRGAYWLVGDDERAPVSGTATVRFVASGRTLRQARLAAAQLYAEDGVGSRILNVTSYEALWRDWDAYRRDPGAWDDPARSYVLHDLFAEDEVNAPLIIVGDFLPSVAEWLPSALQRLRPARFMCPRTNGRAGDIDSVDRLHAISVDDLVTAARDELAWRSRARVHDTHIPTRTQESP